MDSKRIQHIKNQFENAISRAVDSCETSEIEVANHFKRLIQSSGSFANMQEKTVSE